MSLWFHPIGQIKATRPHLLMGGAENLRGMDTDRDEKLLLLLKSVYSSATLRTAVRETSSSSQVIL